MRPAASSSPSSSRRRRRRRRAREARPRPRAARRLAARGDRRRPQEEPLRRLDPHRKRPAARREDGRDEHRRARAGGPGGHRPQAPPRQAVRRGRPDRPRVRLRRRTATVPARRTATAAPTFINDVVVTRRAAWFTDSRRPQLYRLGLSKKGTPAASTSTVPITGDLQYDDDPQNYEVNGIAATQDGRTLFVVQSQHRQALPRRSRDRRRHGGPADRRRRRAASERGRDPAQGPHALRRAEPAEQGGGRQAHATGLGRVSSARSRTRPSTSRRRSRASGARSTPPTRSSGRRPTPETPYEVVRVKR